MAQLSRKRCERFKSGCPMRELLTRLADKWSILLLISLMEAPTHTLRFSELKRTVEGISQRMLTVTLKNLERDGLVSRRVFAEVPPRVEYQLTALGKSVLEPMRGLVDWLEDRWPEIERFRAAYDQRKAK